MMKISVLLVISSLQLYGRTNAYCGSEPSIDNPGCSFGQDVSKVDLPPPGQYGNDTSSREGYAAVYQLVIYYQEGIKFCESVKRNRAASPLKWVVNAKAIFSYAVNTKNYFQKYYDRIAKNTNHEIMFAVSKLSVIYCQYVLYAIVQIFKASLSVITIGTMVYLFEFTLGWLQYGYEIIANFVKLKFLVELVGAATKFSYALGYKYYYYSSECSSQVSSTGLFTNAINFLQKMNNAWYEYVEDLKGLSPTFGLIAQDLIKTIEILYDVLFRYVRQPENFVGPTTKDFYKAIPYLNEVKAIIEANPTVLDNPPLYRSVYCFLENQQVFRITVFIGRLVASFESTTSTYVFKEAYISLKTSVDEVNKYCCTCQ